MTGDHGQWASGAYGNSEIRTPVMDWMAETGIRLEYANARIIRTPRYKLIRRYPGMKAHWPDAFFDLGEYPRETENRIADSRYRDIMGELDAHMETHFARFRDPEREGINLEALTCTMPSARGWSCPGRTTTVNSPGIPSRNIREWSGVPRTAASKQTAQISRYAGQKLKPASATFEKG